MKIKNKEENKLPTFENAAKKGSKRIFQSETTKSQGLSSYHVTDDIQERNRETNQYNELSNPLLPGNLENVENLTNERVSSVNITDDNQRDTKGKRKGLLGKHKKLAIIIPVGVLITTAVILCCIFLI